MLTRASKLWVPLGTVAVLSSPVIASCEGEASVYDEPRENPFGKCTAEPECNDTELERLVMKGRQQFGPFKDRFDDYTEGAKCYMAMYYGKAKDNVCYLRTKAPEEVRIGAVVAGGLVGMMFGFRRGLFRKILYGSLGAGVMAYVAYPEETKYYLKNTKKYAAVGYNFAMGAITGTNPSKCSGPAARLKAEKAEVNIRS